MRRVILGVIFLCFMFATFLNAKMIRSCDSFLFLVDESASMQDVYKNSKKIKIEKDILKKINKSIPDINYLSAMRVFSYKTAYKTDSLYAVSDYDRMKMCNACEKIKNFHKWTSIGFGLYDSQKDLKKMKGIKHLVIFSDGNENATYDAPDKVAAQLHNKFPNLCIFAVQIGNSQYGKKVLSQTVKAAGCGKLYSADALEDNDAFNEFIKDVFGYEQIEKPLPKPVAGPKDTDKDGVYDQYDKCPGTPIGAPVDSYGCWNIPNIYFNFDKYTINQKYLNIIKDVSNVIKKNPSLKLCIKGYTDSCGTEKYNLKLSKNRAEKVKNEFIKNSICPCRLKVKYFGEKYPAATNKTKEGRALNRRVELKVIK